MYASTMPEPAPLGAHPSPAPSRGHGRRGAAGGARRTTTRRYALGGPPDERTLRTVAMMQKTVADSLRDPGVVEQAVDIVRGAEPRDKLGQIQAIHAWLDEYVEFIPDPLFEGDVIRTPALLLRQLEDHGDIRGDCDDIATLAATLAHAVGIAARFVTLGFGAVEGAPFQHVYAELEDQGGKWHPLDVTETDERRATTKPTRRAAYPAVVGFSSLGGLGAVDKADVARKAVLVLGVLFQAARLMRDLGRMNEPAEAEPGDNTDEDDDDEEDDDV